MAASHRRLVRRGFRSADPATRGKIARKMLVHCAWENAMTKFRPWVLILTLTLAVSWSSSRSTQAQGSAASILTGRVTSQEEGSMEGRSEEHTSELQSHSFISY